MFKRLVEKNKGEDRTKKIERRNSFNILVTYLDSSKDVLKKLDSGNFEEAKKILKTTAKEKKALETSEEYINMMGTDNTSEIIEIIRTIESKDC
jgi:soluble cytochrome b562